MVGQIPVWQIVTSALGPPVEKTESFIRYGTGIDEAWEIMRLGIDLGMIEKGGAWFTVPGGEKFQGEEKLYNHIQTNPKLSSALKKGVEEMLC